MNDLDRRLLAAFDGEHREHLREIRRLLPAAAAGPGSAAALDEIFRRAHSLKGAARVVDIGAVESIAHRLESYFSRVRRGAAAVDEGAVRLVGAALDAVEDCVAAHLAGGAPPDVASLLTALGGLAGAAEAPAAPPEPSAETPAPPSAAETLRLSATSLDRLLQEAGLLRAEVLRQGEVARGLGELHRRLTALEHRLGGGAPQARGGIEPGKEVGELARQLRRLRAEHSVGAWSLQALVDDLEEGVQAVRMVPAEGVLGGFGKMVRDLARAAGKEAALTTEGLAQPVDRAVLQLLKDPVMHLLRNAVRHGIELPAERRAAGKEATGRVLLSLAAEGRWLRLVVADDGRGFDDDAIRRAAVDRGLVDAAEVAELGGEELHRLLFAHGLSTVEAVDEVAGRGIGLAVVQRVAATLQGTVEIGARRGGPGTAVTLTVPLTLAVRRLLLVRHRDQLLGISLRGVVGLRRTLPAALATVGGEARIADGERSLPVVALASLLGEEGGVAAGAGGQLSLGGVEGGGRRLAVAVDGLVGEAELLVQPLDERLPVGPGLAGATLLADGSVAPVLDPAGLMDRAAQPGRERALRLDEGGGERRTPTILVVDDSPTTRTLEKSILEASGYRVLLAVDGDEALRRLRSESVDLLIADIQMPRMDGFQLLAQKSEDPGLAAIPSILVTSCEDPRDKARGLELGAAAYLVKRRFEQRELLETIRQIL